MKYVLPVVVTLFLLPFTAAAATLSVTPSSNSVTVGNIVTVRIAANTQGKAINAAEGTLQFPTDLFDIVSVSKGGSIFSLWVEEPSYSDAQGIVTFNGGVPNPGYTGVGTIVTVTLHAKRPGTATLSFADAAIRANDGFGTNVLSGSGSTQITIAEGAVTPAPVPPTTPTPTPTAPTGPSAITNLTSSTHPDQALWYSDANPHLSWTLPKNASAIQTIVGKTPETVPSVVYQPAIDEKQVKELDDGIAYFNVRARTNGTWGPISSYRLQIDATPPTLGNPTFSYDLVRRQLVITNIEASDETSGLSKLELVIDDQQPILILPEEVVNGTYRIEFTAKGAINLVAAAASATTATGGTHTAVLTAYDQAGNRASATGAFVVPVALIDQTLFTLWGISISLLWFLILVLLLMLASLAAAAYAWYRLLTAAKSSRTKAARRERIVHRSLSMFRTDLERHIHALELANTDRELSREEARLKADLEENLADLERYLRKEFKKFDI